MAERVNDEKQIVRASEEHAAPARLPAAVAVGRRGGLQRRSSPHAHRFRVVTAMLVAVGIGAIVVAIIAAGSPGAVVPPQWSEWQPRDTGTQGAWEIANHVAPFYRISATDQLAVVTVVKLRDPAATAASSSSSSGMQIAVADPTTRQISLLPGKTIAFNLCGSGTRDCTIGVGQPSPERLLLLKREALELALYTLRYIPDTQNVAAILPPSFNIQTSTLTLKPPAPTSNPNPPRNYTTVLFERNEVEPALEQPLSETLKDPFPPTVPQMPGWIQTHQDEAALLSQISANGLFTERIVQQQDGSSLMVLNPQPPQ